MPKFHHQHVHRVEESKKTYLRDGFVQEIKNPQLSDEKSIFGGLLAKPLRNLSNSSKFDVYMCWCVISEHKFARIWRKIEIGGRGGEGARVWG